MNIAQAQEIITNDTYNIANRMRALFYLRNIVTDESACVLAKAFASTSVLLKHEVAYCLGQMRLNTSIDVLIRVLDNEMEDEIVRHEAGEALGNYAYSTKIHESLTRNMTCTSTPVQETCFIALQKLLQNKNNNQDVISKYNSRDPALPCDSILSFEDAKNVFLHSSCLYKKYQAMFFLRDLCTAEAVHVLGQGFMFDSFLLKHELCFVFGQMRNVHSIKYLVQVIHKESEHGMVRHESAEALGIIGTNECLQTLIKYQYSTCDILRESVEVAIDLHGYVNSDQVEYCTVE